MTPDSYLSLFFILMSSTVTCVLHGQKLYKINYLFISNFKFGVNFFSIFNSYAPICAPMAEKDTFIKKEWSSTM